MKSDVCALLYHIMTDETMQVYIKILNNND